MNYKEQPLKVKTNTNIYYYDNEQETLIKEDRKTGSREIIGCGKIVIKAAFKKATKKLPLRIDISAELTPDYQKDYEIVDFENCPIANQNKISAHIERFVNKPFSYLDNMIGVEFNFKKEFYIPPKNNDSQDLYKIIRDLSEELHELEAEFLS